MVYFGSLALAFSAGFLSFFNPCSFALLPAYLSYYIGKDDSIKDTSKTAANVFRGAKQGLIASLGFATVFGGIGIIVSFASYKIENLINPILIIIGPILILLGIFRFFEKLDLPFSIFKGGIELPRSSLYLFGMGYALSSLTCVFPVFLMLISTAISTGGFFSGIIVFFAFILSISFFMTTATVAVALSKEAILKKMGKIRKYVTKASGLILIIAGIYILYYWISALIT